MSGPEESVQRRWIAQGQAVSSGELAKALRREPGIRLLAQVSSDVVVLLMTASQAASLRSALAGLVVEPDSALERFGDS